jgi:hypothetical protein
MEVRPWLTTSNPRFKKGFTIGMCTMLFGGILTLFVPHSIVVLPFATVQEIGISILAFCAFWLVLVFLQTSRSGEWKRTGMGTPYVDYGKEISPIVKGFGVGITIGAFVVLFWIIATMAFS